MPFSVSDVRGLEIRVHRLGARKRSQLDTGTRLRRSANISLALPMSDTTMAPENPESRNSFSFWATRNRCQSSFRGSHNDPAGADLRQRLARSRNRGDHIHGVRGRIEKRASEIRPQAGVVSRHHGIAEVHVHRKEGAMAQIAAQRRSARAGHSGDAMGPCDHRPAATRGFLVGGEEHHSRNSDILTDRGARVIQDTNDVNRERKIVVIERFRSGSDLRACLLAGAEAHRRRHSCGGCAPAISLMIAPGRLLPTRLAA